MRTPKERAIGKIRLKCQLADLKSEITCYVIDNERHVLQSTAGKALDSRELCCYVHPPSMLQICRRGQKKSTNSLRRSEAWVEAYCADSKLYDPASGDDSSSEEEVISAPGRDKGPEKPKAEEKPKEDPSLPQEKKYLTNLS